MARIIWGSNSPAAGTGYANQTALLLPALRDLGHPVACVAWWGVEGGVLDYKGIPLYPKMQDPYGNDAMPYWSKKFRADLLITLIDLWVLDGPRLGHLGHTRWAAYFPIDHADPIPPPIAERFPHAHRLVVYSRYAERLVKEYQDGKYAAKVDYIPHTIDTSLYRPADSEAERKGFRRRLFPDWPEDAFICLMVAANKGYPSRKSFGEVIEAFARFAGRHPDARLYLHSLPGAEWGGPDLIQEARNWGVQDKVRTARPEILFAGDYSEDVLRQIYCSADVLLSPSQGEGFGIPIVEAQSTGLSVIVTDHSAMAELCGCGWRVKPLRHYFSRIGGRFAQADPAGIEHALEECYRRPKSSHWRDAAREFALQYDIKRVVRDYWAPWLQRMDQGRRERSLELEWRAGRYQPFGACPESAEVREPEQAAASNGHRPAAPALTGG